MVVGVLRFNIRCGLSCLLDGLLYFMQIVDDLTSLAAKLLLQYELSFICLTSFPALFSQATGWNYCGWSREDQYFLYSQG